MAIYTAETQDEETREFDTLAAAVDFARAEHDICDWHDVIAIKDPWRYIADNYDEDWLEDSAVEWSNQNVIIDEDGCIQSTTDSSGESGWNHWSEAELSEFVVWIELKAQDLN